MYDDKIDSIEEEKPEIRVNYTVYFHATDLDEASDREQRIRHYIQAALAEEDNGLGTFTYPEVRKSWADKFGKQIDASELFHASNV